MTRELTIGTVARMTGLTVKAIRFYESAGFVPAAGRSESGYRRYSADEVRRLRLVRQMRALGLPLAQIKPVVEKALSADCATFAAELAGIFDRQRDEISRRIVELEALRVELDEIAQHISHCECEPGQAVRDCGYCPVLDIEEEGGDCK